MSSTLALLISEVLPDIKFLIIEKLNAPGSESTGAFNNAGTGHAANCELNYTPLVKKGNIKNSVGKVLGVHDGIVNFTIGQRRGIKIAAKEPLYVIDINSDKNEIIVGEKKELIKKNINLKNLNLLADKKFFDEKIFVKVRSTGKLLKSKLNLNNGKTSLTLLEDEYGISPGQACVFYKKDIDGDRVLGGGWITR